MDRGNSTIQFWTFFFGGKTVQLGPRPPHCLEVSRVHARARAVGRIPLNESSASSQRLLLIHQTQERNIDTPSRIFFVPCTSSVLFVLIVLAVPFVLNVQHKHTCPRRDFFCSLYFVCTTLSWLSWLCRLSLMYNTNTHAFGGIRTRNPSKRAAADARLRPLGHWD